MTKPTSRQSDRGTVLAVVIALFAITLFLQHELSLKQALLFLVGIGLGVTLLHAAFGFSGAWRAFIRRRQGQGIRAQLILLGLTSMLFIPLVAGVFGELHASAALGPVGVAVLVGAFLFGVGMQLGGGCGSGTLFTVGGGHVRMLITLGFFIVGATLGSAHLHWWLALPDIGRVSLPEQLGWWQAILLQLFVLGMLYQFVRRSEYRRHGELVMLRATQPRPFLERLLFGPWPLSWGIAGLLLFGLLTLLLAGHPWTITFAFGLWGAKIAMALGLPVETWPYWQSGYAANALHSSVLADTTSVMDFGVILGAVLAAALAGRFAPDSKLQGRDIWSAIIGGLLLGYGARLAFGCNIGALLAGISTGSLHGWLWLVAGFTGSVLGVWLRSRTGIDKPMGART
ncbi:MAG: YeeE/YedE family protein [Granulosicoccaceae bacterium]|jgi:hypothetical protein